MGTLYPMAGRLADTDADTTGGIPALIGPNRAAVLALLDVPRGTSQVAALSGQALGSVGRHLRVLLEAGVVVRRRSGARSCIGVRRSATPLWPRAAK